MPTGSPVPADGENALFGESPVVDRQMARKRNWKRRVILLCDSFPLSLRRKRGLKKSDVG